MANVEVSKIFAAVVLGPPASNLTLPKIMASVVMGPPEANIIVTKIVGHAILMEVSDPPQPLVIAISG